MSVTIEVFTSPTCPNCPPAKNLVQQVSKEREEVKLKETSVASRYGSERAQQFNVMAVPTIFVNGPQSDRIGFRGLPSKKDLNHAIEISLGNADWPEKKNIWKSLKEKVPLKIKW